MGERLPYLNSHDCLLVVSSADLSLLSLDVSAPECAPDPYIEVCVTLSGAAVGNPFTVEVVVVDENSTAIQGVDFELGYVPPNGCPDPLGEFVGQSSLLLEFVPGGESEVCGVVTILDDNIFEVTEFITLAINQTFPFEVGFSPDTELITITPDATGTEESILASYK